ncbi:hypothetical protein [Pseudoclavibacter helvolus]|uniref:hypothetical protein n=1 Tax=Pseudoclavibacter helvolus TaxID=255205 RepID=UPI003C749BEF
MPETRIDQEAESRQVARTDGYWDVYQRRTLPTEALAICGTGIIISAGIITAIATLF